MTSRFIGPCIGALVLNGVLANPISAQADRPIPYHMDPRAPPAAARLELLTLFDSVYQRPRRVWIYTPQGYDPHAPTAYPLMLAFDGLNTGTRCRSR